MRKPIKSQSEYTITWNDDDAQAWAERGLRAKRMNLLQSSAYARAMAKMNNQRIKRGVILRRGQEVGMVQILEAGLLKNAVHAVLLDRGPLWFDGYGSLDDFKGFLDVFSRQYPKRFGRRIRFIPEIDNTDQAAKIMRDYGYMPVTTHGYETIWLDLRPNLEALRKQLSGKWRNKLNQAERQKLDIVWSDEGAHFSWLMKCYAMDKAQRNYDGPSVKTMIALAGEFSRGKNMLIGTAMLDHKPIAAILLLIHDSGATYQIGYTSDDGRNSRAHYLLLWSALGQLKGRNINDFDLGGVNGQSAEGIKKFKKGMGGAVYETLGLYR